MEKNKRAKIQAAYIWIMLGAMLISVLIAFVAAVLEQNDWVIGAIYSMCGAVVLALLPICMD